MVIVSEKLVIRVVQNYILVFLYYIQSVKNIDCVVYAPLDVLEHGIVAFSEVCCLTLSRLRRGGLSFHMLWVLLHRLKVVELLKNIICYLRTGHVIRIRTIFVILVIVHQLVDATLLVLLQTQLSNPLDHSLWELEEFLTFCHDLSGSLVSLVLFDTLHQTSRFIFLLLLTVRIVESL